MAIDDPVSALQALNASDDRQRPLVMGLASAFLGVVKLLAPAGTEIPLTALESAVNWLDRQASENRSEPLNVIAEELKCRGRQIDQILAQDEKQRRFVADELPALVLDGLRRVERSRARDRIARLGRVLLHAAEIGSNDGPDLVEDMLAIAASLSDLDVLVLQRVATEFRKEKNAHPTEAARSVADSAWARVANSLPAGLTEDDLISIGSKLDGVGVAARVERQSWEDPVFRPLDRGYRFLEYIRSEVC